MLEQDAQIQSLIFVSTRELALQVSSLVKEIAKYIKVEYMVSTGGTDFKGDIQRLKQVVHVLVGTSGRKYWTWHKENQLIYLKLNILY